MHLRIRFKMAVRSLIILMELCSLFLQGLSDASLECADSKGENLSKIQRGFDQKRSGISYVLIGSYSYRNQDNKGNNTGRIFVPPPATFGGKRLTALSGSEGSSENSSSNTIINYIRNKPWTPPIATEAQCSKFLDEIAQLKKTLQEQSDLIKNLTQKSDKSIKQTAEKAVIKKGSKKTTPEKSAHQDVYFSSRKTYDEMIKLFDKTTLNGLHPKLRTNADYYLHHLKMNLLVLTSNIQGFSKIEDCFSTFLSRTQEAYYYGSCKGHYEQTCNRNALVTYQDGLRELEYMIAECIRQRIN